MAKPKLPPGLPDSALLQELAKKTANLKLAPSRQPAYLEWLKTLRDRIAPQLAYTNVTFPQFTPHDEQNHIQPLFLLTERLLGNKIIEALNATELFILSCSLYAHDWGMAVSEAEKKCILGLVKSSAADSFTLIDGDKNDFSKLLTTHRIVEPKEVDDVPLEIWQIHVRTTHAARSAHRVRAFFSTIDANLGDAIAIVSEGHNLDVEHLRPFDNALPLQGESANIRALALYLRLIDLFDLAQDRTPYALWKFVNPEHPKSAEEWNKHRALSPVVIEQFQETSRCLKVRGATEDHRVFAALEDLREYCDNQLRLSNGLLNELEPRYQPHLLHLDWKVEPKGFEPITVRFEFERQAMINVLSDEIYQGDHYVFLRELLQNSIDAIRLRRSLHQNKRTGVTFDGAIHVKVEHQGKGGAIVSWTDNGCGMNAFIVRNYLTVAGRSFYRSEDFQKLGVKMDPISRFGVGILSCFMVAERLEIVTRQDPQLEAAAEALRIEVHNPQRHLRIQRLCRDPLPSVGTTVKVFIGSLAAKAQANSPALRLNVIEYIREIAGFVEFPIYVDVDGKRTVILHPDQIGSDENLKDWEVASLDRSFAWTDFFVPQDVKRARDYFTEETIKIKATAKHSLFEGTISYPVLKEGIELRDGAGVPGEDDAFIVVQGDAEIGRIRIRREWGTKKKPSGISRSSACDNLCRIYCNGILVPGVSVPDWADSGGWRQPSTFRILLNMRQTAGVRLDLSRHDIAAGAQDWSNFVLDRCLDSFRSRVKQIVRDKTPNEALYHLARLVAYGNAFRMNLSKIIGESAIPLMVLEETGAIRVSSPEVFDEEVVRVVPGPLAESLAKKLFAGWAKPKWLNGNAPQIQWFGARCVFAERMTHGTRIESPKSLAPLEELHEAWLDAWHALVGVQFLSPGKKGELPLVQQLWMRKKSDKRKAKAQGQAVGFGFHIKARLALLRYDFSYNAPEFVIFKPPFDKFFTAGWNYLNVLHPVTEWLLKCLESISNKQSVGTISEHDLGTIRDALEPVFGRVYAPWREYISGNEIDEKCEAVEKFFELTASLGLFELPTDLVWTQETLNVPPVVKAGRQGSPIQSLREVGLS